MGDDFLGRSVIGLLEVLDPSRIRASMITISRSIMISPT